MTELTHLPTKRAGAISLASAVVAAAAGGAGSATGLAIGLIGVGFIAFGLTRTRLFTFDFGGLFLFGAVLHSGLETGLIEVTLVGTVASVLAWDLGHTARDLGVQLGRETDTTRLEHARFVGSVAVAVTSAGLGYAIFFAAQGVESTTALAAMIVAVLFATFALSSGIRRVRTAPN